MLSENGAAVAIFDMDETKGQAAAKLLSNSIFCKVDVASEESVKDGFQKVREAYGRLDIMVNSAGIVGPNGVKTEDVDTAAFDKVYKGNALILSFWVNSGTYKPSIKETNLPTKDMPKVLVYTHTL